MPMPRCEWITDGWPHRQCERMGSQKVYMPTAVFPESYFCARHAQLVKKMLVAGKWGY